MPLEESRQREWIRGATRLRLVDRVGEASAVDHRREVEDRPGNGSHRDAVAAADLVGGERRAVPGDARLPAVIRAHRHVGTAAAIGGDSPQRRGGSVTQHGILPTCQHGRHPSSTAGQRAMSDRIHAAVEQVEATAGEAVLDRAAAEAEGEKL
jgi:hypothetical protein